MYQKIKLLFVLSYMLPIPLVFSASNTVIRTRISAGKALLKRGTLSNKDKKKYLKEFDSFYDQKRNYAIFSGRVTDKDKSNTIFKITSENKNIKFLRAGDELLFSMPKNKSFKQCQANVRSTEPGYVIIFISDIAKCWSKDKYFRRGVALVFESEVLATRVKEAAFYRIVLIKRRKDFLNQLNNINHFLWSFAQQKIQTAQDYDIKISRMEKAKLNALEVLQAKRIDNMNLQKELIFRLDSLDNELEYQRVENSELYYDRWHLDQDLGLPVYRRPQEKKAFKGTTAGRVDFD